MVTSQPAGRLPDFLIVGAPKAGTSALHAALAQHPQLAMSPVKEPKYFLCGDAPPPLFTGPGDAHSRREWIWRRADYLDLFPDPGADVLCGESTPLYLADSDARRRIATTIAHVRLICVLRDPVDRAYSNWTHLWVDGLEPIADVVEACFAEETRIRDGWAPFWHYLRLGRYGEQIASLYELFPRDQILLLRYRDLVDTPKEALDRVCEFLGVQHGQVSAIPGDNTRPFVMDGWQTRALLAHFEDDIDLLEQATGIPFADWRSETGQGAFATRAGDRSR